MSPARSWRRGATGAAAAVLLAAWLPATAAAQPRAGQITAIDAPVAARGAIVTIQGRGFGGPHVAVTVDGIPVDVLNATGSSATFQVPALAGPGNVVVRATNPGGHTGTIALNVLFDGNVAPLVNPDAAVRQTVGREGGTIDAGDVTLLIPPGALHEEQEITVTPLAGLVGSPFAGAMTGAHLEPDGLSLVRPAVLSFALPDGVTAADVLGFGFTSSGADLHLVPPRLVDGRVELDIWHFSGAGGSFGRFVDGVPTWNPGTAETQALHDLALATDLCVVELTRDGAPGFHCDQFAGRARLALHDWYEAAVGPGLEQAEGAPSFELEAALHEWLRWRGQLQAQQCGDSIQQPCISDLGPLAETLATAHRLATAALADIARRRLANCTGTDLRSQLKDVLRVADYANAGGVGLTTLGLPAFAPDLPEVAGFLDLCAGIRIERPTFPAVAARQAPNRLAVRAFVGTYTGAEPAAPVNLFLTVGGGASEDSSATLDRGATFRTNVFPSAGAAHVDLTIVASLHADALPDLTELERASFFGAKSFEARWTARERMTLEGPVRLEPGESGPIDVTLAGDDIAGRRIDFEVDAGVGQLSTPTVVTGPTGEASLTFTADASASGDATIKATFVDDDNHRTEFVTIPIARVAITVSPGAPRIPPRGTVQFTATVTGSPNTDVTWSVSGGGGIDGTGRFTSDGTLGTFTIRATSVADPSKSGEAQVTVHSPPIVSGFLVAGFVENGTVKCRGRVDVNQVVPVTLTSAFDAGMECPLPNVTVTVDGGPGPRVTIDARGSGLGDFINEGLVNVLLFIEMELPGAGVLVAEVHPGAVAGNATVEARESSAGLFYVGTQPAVPDRADVRIGGPGRFTGSVRIFVGGSRPALDPGSLDGRVFTLTFLPGP